MTVFFRCFFGTGGRREQCRKDPHEKRLKLSDSKKYESYREKFTHTETGCKPLDWFTRFSISCYFGGYYQSGAADGDIEAD